MSWSQALEGRVRAMLGRAIVRLVDDARLVQELQIDLLEDESQDAAERFQNYGFTSSPHPGAEGIVACIGGLRSHAVVLAVDDRRYRLKNLQAGEVALYDDLGNVVKLGRERVEIIAQSKVQLTAPDGLTINADAVINGDIELNGKLTATVDVLAAGKSLKTHVHTGVTAGAGNSGSPL